MVKPHRGSSSFHNPGGGLGVGADTGISVGGGSSGPAVGDGILLETGTDFLLLETGDFLLQE